MAKPRKTAGTRGRISEPRAEGTTESLIDEIAGVERQIAGVEKVLEGHRSWIDSLYSVRRPAGAEVSV